MDFEGPIDVGAETAAVATGATLPAIHLETPPAASSAEAVRFDLDMARKCGMYTLAYLARAGWRLANEKQSLGHGAWMKWCSDELSISHDTANRYIKFYYATVGEHLRSQGTARRLVEDLTDAMIADATAGLESKTATGAMIELGIVKRPPNWGGEREGAGRKAKEVAAAAAAAGGDGLDMGDSATLMWLEAMKPFEANRAAFHSAARDLNVNVASRFLEELRMLEGALAARVKGGEVT